MVVFFQSTFSSEKVASVFFEFLEIVDGIECACVYSFDDLKDIFFGEDK